MACSNAGSLMAPEERSSRADKRRVPAMEVMCGTTKRDGRRTEARTQTSDSPVARPSAEGTRSPRHLQTVLRGVLRASP